MELYQNINNIHEYLDATSPELSHMFWFTLISHSNPFLYSQDKYGRTPIHYAALIRDSKSLKSYLHNKIYDIDKQDSLGYTALGNLIHVWNPTHSDAIIEIVIILLSYGANPNLCGYGMPTPLMQAVMTENTILVECLLIAGANPFAKLEEPGLFFRKGETALSLATRLNTLVCSKPPLTNNQLHIIHSLIQYGKARPEYIFHALQHTKTPFMKRYLMECMRR